MARAFLLAAATLACAAALAPPKTHVAPVSAGSVPAAIAAAVPAIAAQPAPAAILGISATIPESSLLPAPSEGLFHVLRRAGGGCERGNWIHIDVSLVGAASESVGGSIIVGRGSRRARRGGPTGPFP